MRTAACDPRHPHPNPAQPTCTHTNTGEAGQYARNDGGLVKAGLKVTAHPLQPEDRFQEEEGVPPTPNTSHFAPRLQATYLCSLVFMASFTSEW